VTPEQSGALFPDAERPESFPDEVVAEARVIDVREHTSGLLVTHSSREVALGDRAVMRTAAPE
jgi:hypothetical protein